MSIIQDKLSNEFLRNGGMEPNFAPSMLMFSHLPPVTSFTRLAAQSVMQDLPQEMILKKERNSPDHSGSFIHSMGIKQEKMTEHDYRMAHYGSGMGKSTELLEMSLGGHQNLLVHDLSLSNVRPKAVSRWAICPFWVILSIRCQMRFSFFCSSWLIHVV